MSGDYITVFRPFLSEISPFAERKYERACFDTIPGINIMVGQCNRQDFHNRCIQHPAREDGFARLRPSHGGCLQHPAREDGFVYIYLSLRGKINQGVAAGLDGGKQQSTGLLHLNVRIHPPSLPPQKTAIRKDSGLLWQF